MTNSPRYVGFIDPPYIVTLTDDTGAAINLTGCTSNSFTLTMLDENTGLSQQGTGVWTITNATAGQASYQWTSSDMATAGPWQVYTTVKLPSEPSPREFDPDLILILPGTVGAGAAPAGVLPAPIAKALYFNVRDYGARGDGTTNDTAAIQATINAATSAGGGTVYLPPGTYIASAATGILLSSNIIFAGAGASTIIKIPNNYNTSGDLLQAVSCTNVVIRDLLLEGNKANQSSGTNYGLFLSTSTNSLVSNVIAQNFNGDGIQIYRGTNCQVVNSYGISNGFHGMETERCTACVFKGNFFLSNTLHGLFISPGEVGGTGSIANTYIGNVCQSNAQYGIAIGISNIGSEFLSTDDVITGNIVRSNSQYGIQVYKANGITISNNDVSLNGFFGIYLFESANNQVIGNRLHNNSQSSNNGYDEIYMEGYSTDNTHPAQNNIVANNLILIDGANKARYAINEGTSHDGPNTIVNNVIPSAGATGSINSLCTTDILSTPAGVYQVYGGNIISGANAGIDNAFNITRLFSNLANSDIQIVSAAGSTHFYNNGTEYLTIDTNGNITVHNSSLATSATNGFLYIPTCAGTPTGVPSSKAGLVPMVYDTTNHKFWIYDTAWKGVVLA